MSRSSLDLSGAHLNAQDPSTPAKSKARQCDIGLRASAACSNDMGVSGPMKKPATDHAASTAHAEPWRAVPKTPSAEMAVSQEKPCWSSR